MVVNFISWVFNDLLYYAPTWWVMTYAGWRYAKHRIVTSPNYVEGVDVYDS